MLFSKSFGYAIRSILYIAMQQETRKKVQLDEIARVLNVPRYFVGKVMNRLVKEGMLDSIKGHYGGFCINEKTLGTTLAQLSDVTGDNRQFDLCILQLRECSETNPCPLHNRVVTMRHEYHAMLARTTIGELLNRENADFLGSLTVVGPQPTF
jgi:Rrf2 family transcriptional regulator, iron-sulfur cluster assembly transcription factor